MTITERIAVLLKSTARTQRDLCLYLGVAPSTVSDWFKRRNESIPSAYIVPICKYFNISPQELLTGEVNGQVLLSQDELKLVTLYRALDQEGQTMTAATAINESRRMEAKDGNN